MSAPAAPSTRDFVAMHAAGCRAAWRAPVMVGPDRSVRGISRASSAEMDCALCRSVRHSASHLLSASATDHLF
jgi:hypothetical protein